MARDYKKEYQNAKSGGYLPKASRWTLTLTGEYPDQFMELLEKWNCKTLGEFIRQIIDGKLEISKRF